MQNICVTKLSNRELRSPTNIFSFVVSTEMICYFMISDAPLIFKIFSEQNGISKLKRIVLHTVLLN